jgi:hypothetical protein
MAKKWERWKTQKGIFRIIFRSIGRHPPQLNAQLLCALELAYSEIFRLITTSRMIQETHTHDSGDVLKTIADAIAAAKGEE